MTRVKVDSVKTDSLEITIFKCTLGFHNEGYEIEAKSLRTGCKSVVKRISLAEAKELAEELLNVF